MPFAWTIALVVLTQTPPAPTEPVLQRPGGSTTAPPAPQPDEVVPTAEAPRIGVAILRADELDQPALARALQLRSPRLTLVAAGEEAPPAAAGELRAYIEVRRREPALVDLTLILPDGRAWLRPVEVDPDAPTRPIAGALANLIAGIEDESVAPDRKDVAIPQALVEPPPEPEIVERPPAQDTTPPTPAPEPPPPPRWQLGPGLRLGATLGLAAPDPGLHGLGFGGGLDARSPRGLLLALDLQLLARPLGQYLVTRTRIAVGVGYALRRGNFEVPAALLVGVEPWRLRRDGERVGQIDSKDGPPRPLLGAGLRLSPGYSAPVGKSARLRVGLRLELWTSGQPHRGGLGKARLLLPDGPPDISVGGPELHLGLEIGLWFDVGKPKPPR